MKELTESSDLNSILLDRFDGEIFTDNLHRLMYATDASAYREIPLGVVQPKHSGDLKNLIEIAGKFRIPLIPRTAGTSLAGQVVGSGLIVDISRHMTKILEINVDEHWARVQPGVIPDELNKTTEPLGLFFGPETSTSSRCMIGGMVGNNSCGAHSILYGSTRDHIISVKGFLSDCSEVEFGAVTPDQFLRNCDGDKLENRIYRQINDILSDKGNREQIHREYPDPAIHRRNTGYAIDLLLQTDVFNRQPVAGNSHGDACPDNNPAGGRRNPFNFSKLIAGSEGTLMLMTEIKVNLLPLPPKEKALICVHCHTVADALNANLIALKHKPGSVELMDKPVMDCTKDNITQRQNRFFIEGDPGAILIIEFARDSREEIAGIHKTLEKEMKEAGLGYHFPIIYQPDLKKVWDLRKAGLGALSNYPGDRKPVSVTEDTAVNPAVLPKYIEDFEVMMEGFGLRCVYYGHVGSGELHLRPVLNLKDPGDVELFRTVALETAKLVKRYNGSLSGEHGDGRLRGEFIPLMLGEHNYNILKSIKALWDPVGIFNPGKITDTPHMNTHLRFRAGGVIPEITTVFDFSDSHGILRAAERCNGSGDCRNTALTGRWMCPSYMATLDETDTTRARANILREFLTNSGKANPFDHSEIYEVMDLCLSCKACKSECPSNVDIAKLKAEFLQHYYDAEGIPFRARLIANITSVNRIGSMAPYLFNYIVKNKISAGIIKKTIGFSSERNIPLLFPVTLRQWYARYNQNINTGRVVFLFADEFTNFNDVPTGMKAIMLLNALGYRVVIPDHKESGRTFLSKGLVRKAKKLADDNVRKLKGLISESSPLIGIEPSAILTFRDEYPDLVDSSLKEDSKKLSENVFMFEEFVMQDAGCRMQDVVSQFTRKPEKIILHGHCHQKALGSVETTRRMLSIPVNYEVTEIKSGCCGMAGAFGYEKEHYDLSMKVGELVLFPEVRKASDGVIIAAPGTSCRHHINHGTGRTAFHPVEILYDALLKK